MCQLVVELLHLTQQLLIRFKKNSRTHTHPNNYGIGTNTQKLYELSQNLLCDLCKICIINEQYFDVVLQGSLGFLSVGSNSIYWGP